MQLYLPTIQAVAVGAAVARALSSDNPQTIDEWVAHCNKAADAAAEAIRLNPPIRAEEQPGAIQAFLLENEDPADPLPNWCHHDQPEPISGPELEEQAAAAAAEAFKASMPMLTTRRATTAYIACTAVALQRGFVTAAEGRSLLYTAQLALTAHKSRPRRRSQTQA